MENDSGASLRFCSFSFPVCFSLFVGRDATGLLRRSWPWLENSTLSITLISMLDDLHASALVFPLRLTTIYSLPLSYLTSIHFTCVSYPVRLRIRNTLLVLRLGVVFTNCCIAFFPPLISIWFSVFPTLNTNEINERSMHDKSSQLYYLSLSRTVHIHRCVCVCGDAFWTSHLAIRHFTKSHPCLSVLGGTGRETQCFGRSWLCLNDGLAPCVVLDVAVEYSLSLECCKFVS